MDPLTIGTIGMGLFKAGSNFFGDDGAAQRAHQQNKARVAQIDRQNQKTHFSNLKIRGRALNKQATLDESLYNYDTASLQRKASREKNYNRATQDAFAQNQDDVVRLFRSMTGSRAGRMNLDSAALAEAGRASALRRNKLMRSKDDLITSGYLDEFQTQNQRAQAKASVNQPTKYQQYITGYTPVKAGTNMTNKLLGLAGDLGSTALSGLKMHNSLKPPEFDKDSFVKDIDLTGGMFD